MELSQNPDGLLYPNAYQGFPGEKSIDDSGMFANPWVDVRLGLIRGAALHGGTED
jgi:hypothetical protein